MPTNLTPEYRKVEAEYRKASDPADKLALLKQMLSVMPKHKGTDHLQADIKSRIKQLSEELSSPSRGRRSGPTHVVHPEGAAQIALIGPPNTGKSSLHGLLCGSSAVVGDYPFTTAEPLPGMLPYEDVLLQLVDLPPVSREHQPPWLANALQPADGCLFVVDLLAADCVDACMDVIDWLGERRVYLTAQWPAPQPEDDAALDPFASVLPTLLTINKCDQISDVDGEAGVFFELIGREFPWIAVSAKTGMGLQEIGRWLFGALQIVRVYTKTPGKAVEADRPFTVRRGDTVRDVARQVHQELGESMKFARIWGSETFDGQQVGPDHEVADGDVVEIHA